jgi:hypothetical protein
MGRHTLALLFILLSTAAAWSQSLYICRTGEASFYSKAPLENIEAFNRNTTSILNTANGEIAFTVPIKAFRFEKELMQEHFNEKYMESDKYPLATFKGKINEKVDYTKNGVYKVTTTGKLSIHGVEKDRTEKGTLTVKDGNITIDAEMKVTLNDFNITIPKLVFENIAETVDVKIHAPYVPFKK